MSTEKERGSETSVGLGAYSQVVRRSISNHIHTSVRPAREDGQELDDCRVVGQDLERVLLGQI